MKRVFLPLLVVVCAPLVVAQSPLEVRISRQIQATPAQLGVITEAEKRMVVNRVADLLQRHVTFRNDGSAASQYDSTTGRQHHEWMNLRIHKLATAPLTKQDMDRGVTKRVQVQLVYDQCRSKDAKANDWGSWSTVSRSLFPLVIHLEWVGGRVLVDAGMHLQAFKPGPQVSAVATNVPASTSTQVVSVAAAQSSSAASRGTMLRATSASTGLPAGMSRASR